MCNINNKYPGDAEEHFGLRNIIDLQYETKTKVYFYELATVYLFGFAVPFTL